MWARSTRDSGFSEVKGGHRVALTAKRGLNGRYVQ
jgi:hypothetical protein